MKNIKKQKMKKVIYIVLLALTALIILSGISAYFLIHNYINKMHLINTRQGSIQTAADDENNLGESSTEESTKTEDPTKITLFSEESSETSSDTAKEDAPNESSQSTEGMDTASDHLNETDDQTIKDDGGAVDVFNEVDSDNNKKITLLDQSIADNLKDSSPMLDDPDVLNILLIGSDTRNSDEAGRSDSMIIITINEKKQKIVATSFLRDIYLSIPGNENNRLNAAYAFGGADLLLEVLETNFKFKIDNYIMVDFYAFIDIVDAIGGVQLSIDENELDIINMYIREINQLEGAEPESDVLTATGLQLLNGKQALGYARNRYSANGDFDRTSRQREVLTAIYDKAKDQDLLEMNSFLNVILPQITTNLSESEILTHLLKLPTYFDYGMEQWSVPVSGSYRNVKVRGMSVLGIDFKVNIREIAERLYQ